MAHAELDAAVEAAYGVDFNGDEEKIVAHLFKLYAERPEKRANNNKRQQNSAALVFKTGAALHLG